MEGEVVVGVVVRSRSVVGICRILAQFYAGEELAVSTKGAVVRVMIISPRGLILIDGLHVWLVLAEK